MRQWIIANNFANDEELEAIEKEAKKIVREGKKAAWEKVTEPAKTAQKQLIDILNQLASESQVRQKIEKVTQDLASHKNPEKHQVLQAARNVLLLIIKENLSQNSTLLNWTKEFSSKTQLDYSSHLYSESSSTAINIEGVEPTYDEEAELVDARIVIRDNFDAIFGSKPETLIFGEDSGNIGDVNQGLEGLQEKYGELRVADAGIREATILGQGIGMAMRGLRPIAEIQYLDYLLYALQIMSDDLATLQYRTKGKQKAPLIVRTRGHRLEGIWHSGSPMGGIIHLLRGIHVLVPRNMTKAAGFYNTMLASDEPALIVECLNGYRLKEKLPNNLGEFKTPIGVVETIREGKDITLVSYGSTLRIIEDAAELLSEIGIDCEIIDVQSLLPFDLNQDIVKSVAKTNRLLVIDEDVPGGASSYILQQIVENQNAYVHLDSKPQTLTAKAHRPAYGTDGDYFSKPSVDDVFDKVYSIFNEVNPKQFPTML